MECPHCPSKNPGSAKFCGSCGTELVRSTPSLPPRPIPRSSLFRKIRAVFSDARPRALIVLLLAGVVGLAGVTLRNYVIDRSSGNTVESQRNWREPDTGSGTHPSAPSIYEPTTSEPQIDWTVIAEPTCDSSTPPIDITEHAAVSVPSTAPPGIDSDGNTVNYPSSNMLDDNPATAWRMPGDGSDSSLQITFDQDVLLCEVGIVNGYAKTDTASNVLRYYEGRRITRVTWQSARTTASFTLPETTNITRNKVHLDTATRSLKLTIDDTTSPGSAAPQHDYTAISTLRFIGFIV